MACESITSGLGTVLPEILTNQESSRKQPWKGRKERGKGSLLAGWKHLSKSGGVRQQNTTKRLINPVKRMRRKEIKLGA